MNKCVVVIGPESSGSKLAAKICAHVLGVRSFGEWNAAGWCGEDGPQVGHRSLPYGWPPVFPDIPALIGEHGRDRDVRFVLTTRDITLSEISRFHRWGKAPEQARRESLQAREIMAGVLRSDRPVFLWSYETFMFLGKDYLAGLYRFLEVESDFCPELADGNAARLLRPGGLAS